MSEHFDPESAALENQCTVIEQLESIQERIVSLGSRLDEAVVLLAAVCYGLGGEEGEEYAKDAIERLRSGKHWICQEPGDE